MKRILILLIFSSLYITAFCQGLSDDTIHWIEYRKLSWNDFKGEAIKLPGISGQTMIVLLANFHKGNLFLPTKTSVATVFDRRNSWIVDSAKSVQSLKYYQVMFDLYEVYTRRLKKELKNTKFGLDPNKLFQEKYNAALTALSDRNKQYFKETKLGTDSESVEKWNQTIQTELNDLKEYK
jgi:hypothetical protein